LQVSLVTAPPPSNLPKQHSALSGIAFAPKSTPGYSSSTTSVHHPSFSRPRSNIDLTPFASMSAVAPLAMCAPLMMIGTSLPPGSVMMTLDVTSSSFFREVASVPSWRTDKALAILYAASVSTTIVSSRPPLSQMGCCSPPALPVETRPKIGTELIFLTAAAPS